LEAEVVEEQVLSISKETFRDFRNNILQQRIR
jgi:hypothetical protein